MKKTFLLIALSAFLFSCETDVTDKVKTDVYDGVASVSIDGAITNIDTIGTYLNVQFSNPYLSTSQYQKIENAEVRLFEEDSLLGIVPEVRPGRYERLDFVAQEGKHYRIEVDVPSAYGAAEGLWESTPDFCNPHYSLFAPLFPILEGDSTYYDFRLGDSVYYADADSAYYSPYLFFIDPPGKGNGYWVKKFATTQVYAPNGLQGPFIPQETKINRGINLYNDDQFIEGPQISRYNFFGPPYTVFRDTLTNIVFETRTVSPQLYQYLTIMNTNVNNGGLFSVPYSPQIGNIRRADDTTVFGLGYFYATSIRFDSITMFHPF